MGTIWQELFKSELAWWKSLTAKQKFYAGYFLFSFTPATWNGRRKSLMAGYAGRAELRQFRTAVKTSADK